MNKLIYFAFAAAPALLLAACAKTDEQQAPKGRVVTLSASIEEDEETRAMVSDDGKFTWAEGDQIGVWTSDGKFTAFTLDGEGGSISGNFSAELPDGIFVAEGPVVYPYNANHSYSDAQIGYYIPQTSNWDDGQTKSHMAAMCDGKGGPIQFKQLDGLLSFTLYNLPSSVRSFRLKTATSKIWSVDGATTFTVSIDQDRNLGNITQKTRTGAGYSNTYLNHTSDGTTGKIYQVNFPLPVGTYSDLQFEVMSGTGGTGSVIGETKNIPSTDISRASMVTMPALTYNYLELTYKESETAFRDNFNKYPGGSTIGTDGTPELVSNEGMRSINNASKKNALRITASGTEIKGGVFMIRTNLSDYNDVYGAGWRDDCKGFTLMIRYNSEGDIDKFYPHAWCKGAKYRKDSDPVDDIKRLPDRINGVPFTGEGQTVENWKKLIKAGEWNVLQWTNTHGATFQIEVYPFLDFSGNNVDSANRIMYFDGFRLLK